MKINKVPDYGMAASMRLAHGMFCAASRRTGRTVELVAQARDGDVIVVADSNNKQYVEHRLSEAGKKCRVIYGELDRIADRLERLLGGRQGRALFDNSWIEQVWEKELGAIERRINTIAHLVSGPNTRQPVIATHMGRRFEGLRA